MISRTHNAVLKLKIACYLCSAASFIGMIIFSNTYWSVGCAILAGSSLLVGSQLARYPTRSRSARSGDKVIYGSCPHCAHTLGISVSSTRQRCAHCDRVLELAGGRIVARPHNS
jgi:hypothetical protein